MGYTEFKNGQAPYLSESTLNQMQVELMKMVFPIRINIHNSNWYKSKHNTKVWNLGKA